VAEQNGWDERASVLSRWLAAALRTTSADQGH
jgi:hypothetical protein